MAQLSKPIQKVIEAYWRKLPQETYGKDEPKIKVHATISRIAFVYEKVRNAIEYKDEHLLRKNAIERMLKRRLYTEEKHTNLGRLLLTELIRARYLKNNTIPERIIGELDVIISKYLVILDALAPNRLTRERRSVSNWLLAVLSTEIEHHLVAPIREDALVEGMYTVIRQDVDLANTISDPEERDLQVYIAIHRSLIKSDNAIIRYHLLNHYFPLWRSGTPEVIEELRSKFSEYKQRIDEQVNHPFGLRLLRFMKRFSVLFTILQSVIEADPRAFEKLATQPEKFEEKIRESCNGRYAKARIKQRRSYLRTIIYVFITKMMLALIIEYPYDRFFIHSTDYFPLAINVLFHPILMLIIAVSIKLPTNRNTDKIVELLKKIIYNEPEPGFLYKKRKTFKRSRVTQYIFNIFYLIAFVVTFGAVIWVLQLLNFNIVSGVIFIFFISVISFFGVKLRREAQELVILDERDSLLTILVDFFSLPVLRVGRWLSEKTPKINLFIFILDFIIEAPLKIFVEVIEDWVSFQREKKEEMY